MFTPAGKKEKTNQLGTNPRLEVESGVGLRELGLLGQAISVKWEEVRETVDMVLEKAKTGAGRAELKLFELFSDLQKTGKDGMSEKQVHSLVSMLTAASLILSSCGPVEGSNPTQTKDLPTPIVELYTATPGITDTITSPTATKEILPVGACLATTEQMRSQGDITALLPTPSEWTEKEKTGIVDGEGNPVYPAVELISRMIKDAGLVAVGVAVGGSGIGGVVVIPKDEAGNYVYATERDAQGNVVASGRIDGNGSINKDEAILVPQPPRGELKVWMQGESGGGSCAYYAAVYTGLDGEKAVGKFNPVTRVWEMDKEYGEVPLPPLEVMKVREVSQTEVSSELLTGVENAVSQMKGLRIEKWGKDTNGAVVVEVATGSGVTLHGYPLEIPGKGTYTWLLSDNLLEYLAELEIVQKPEPGTGLTLNPVGNIDNVSQVMTLYQGMIDVGETGREYESAPLQEYLKSYIEANTPENFAKPLDMVWVMYGPGDAYQLVMEDAINLTPRIGRALYYDAKKETGGSRNVIWSQGMFTDELRNELSNRVMLSFRGPDIQEQWVDQGYGWELIPLELFSQQQVLEFSLGDYLALLNLRGTFGASAEGVTRTWKNIMNYPGTTTEAAQLVETDNLFDEVREYIFVTWPEMIKNQVTTEQQIEGRYKEESKMRFVVVKYE